MLRPLFTHLFFFLALAGLFAQSQPQPDQSNVDHIGRGVERGFSVKEIMRKAQAAEHDKNYREAMHLYMLVLRYDSLHTEALSHYADAALAHSAYVQADSAYQVLIDRNLPVSDEHIWYYGLGESKFRLGEYPAAKVAYDEFLNGKQGDNAPAKIKKRAKLHLESVEWAIAELAAAPKVLATPLDSPRVNTGYFAEYSPRPLDDKLYFSAYRFPNKRDKYGRESHLVKVLLADALDTTQQAEVLGINEEKRHTMHVAFDRTGNVIYYTIAEFAEGSKIRIEKQAIYRRQRADRNSPWGPSRRLPASVNQPGSIATSPSVGWKDGQPGQVLFFVSDRPGGQGDKDIWYAPIVGDSVGAATNLIALNTPEDDVTPYYHARSQTLYFSTEGRRTLGGFDIWESKGYGTTWSEPEHLSTEINSPGNDVFYAPIESGAVAYFSSDRLGVHDTKKSEDGCCYDIFRAELAKPEMLAVTFDCDTKDSLPGATIRLFEKTATGLQEIASATPPNSFSYFTLKTNHTYVLTAEKAGYEGDTLEAFTTPKEIWPEPIVKHLCLRRCVVKLIVNVFEKGTNQPLYGTSVRLTNLTSSEANTTSSATSNRYEFKLDFNKHYRIEGSKPGYTTDSGDTSTFNTECHRDIVMNLYIQRGIKLVAEIFDECTKQPLPGAVVQLVDAYTDARLLEKTDPSTNRFEALLEFDKRYRVVADKPGYFPDSVEFNTTNIALQDFQNIYQKLYLPSTDPACFLPFNVYFDNDSPRPDKKHGQTYLVTTCDSLYEEVNFPYFAKMKVFEKGYAGIMTGPARDKAIADIDSFFFKEVRGGREKLKAFLEAIEYRLGEGDTIKIQVAGHASPLARPEYNLPLTGRRIYCVMNHFRIQDAGALQKYFDNHQLQVVEVPAGEKDSPPGISDNPADKRNSIYSLAASRERRVQITSLEIQQKAPPSQTSTEKK